MVEILTLIDPTMLSSYCEILPTPLPYTVGGWWFVGFFLKLGEFSSPQKGNGKMGYAPSHDSVSQSILIIHDWVYPSPIMSVKL